MLVWLLWIFEYLILSFKMIHNQFSDFRWSKCRPCTDWVASEMVRDYVEWHFVWSIFFVEKNFFYLEILTNSLSFALLQTLFSSSFCTSDGSIRWTRVVWTSLVSRVKWRMKRRVQLPMVMQPNRLRMPLKPNHHRHHELRPKQNRRKTRNEIKSFSLHPILIFKIHFFSVK